MPTYEYKCTQCENQFDLWQSVGEVPPACPECQSNTKKVFRPVSVIFKGSGFYVTDKRAESSSGKKPEKSENDETKTDAKTETAAEPAKTEAKPAETKTETAPAKADAK